MKALVFAALLALAACVTMTPAEQAALQEQAARPVTCSGSDDCEVKWGRAIQWVLSNSQYRIQVQTDQLIQTAGPTPDSPVPAFVISRVAMGGGNYSFSLQGGCDNPFGCVPSLLESQASFVDAVMGGPTKPAPPPATPAH